MTGQSEVDRAIRSRVAGSRGAPDSGPGVFRRLFEEAGLFQADAEAAARGLCSGRYLSFEDAGLSQVTFGNSHRYGPGVEESIRRIAGKAPAVPPGQAVGKTERARSLIGERARRVGVVFTALEVKGLMADLPLVGDGGLDESGFVSLVDEAAAEAKADRGRPAPREADVSEADVVAMVRRRAGLDSMGSGS